MKRLKTMGALLVALFAFSAVAATAAQAEEAPYWSIEGTRLAAGKTAEITAKAEGNQVLTANNGTEVVTCTAVKVGAGAVLLGSNAGEPGRSDEKLEYSGCTVTGNGTKCAVENNEVKTEPLTNELAYAENKKSVVIEFDPRTGHTLATLKFKAETGGTCTLATTKVTGLVAAQVFSKSPEVLLELGNSSTSAASFLLKAPNPRIKTIWLITAGTGSSFAVEELNSFGAESVLTGTAVVSLSSGKNWSPLF